MANEILDLVVTHRILALGRLIKTLALAIQMLVRLARLINQMRVYLDSRPLSQGSLDRTNRTNNKINRISKNHFPLGPTRLLLPAPGFLGRQVLKTLQEDYLAQISRRTNRHLDLDHRHLTLPQPNHSLLPCLVALLLPMRLVSHQGFRLASPLQEQVCLEGPLAPNKQGLVQ